nr:MULTISPECIES: HAD hydrolase family protein [unclassified Collinsella]
MSDATWAMLDELARRGIEFVPCTGRPLSGIFEPMLAHPAVHYAVCANGASVWQLNDDVPTDASRATRILSRPLDRGFAQAHTNTDRHGYRQQDRRGRDARKHRHVLARPGRSRRHRRGARYARRH